MQSLMLGRQAKRFALNCDPTVPPCMRTWVPSFPVRPPMASLARRRRGEHTLRMALVYRIRKARGGALPSPSWPRSRARPRGATTEVASILSQTFHRRGVRASVARSLLWSPHSLLLCRCWWEVRPGPWGPSRGLSVPEWFSAGAAIGDSTGVLVSFPLFPLRFVLARGRAKDNTQ